MCGQSSSGRSRGSTGSRCCGRCRAAKHHRTASQHAACGCSPSSDRPEHAASVWPHRRLFHSRQASIRLISLEDVNPRHFIEVHLIQDRPRPVPRAVGTCSLGLRWPLSRPVISHQAGSHRPAGLEATVLCQLIYIEHTIGFYRFASSVLPFRRSSPQHEFVMLGEAGARACGAWRGERRRPHGRGACLLLVIWRLQTIRCRAGVVLCRSHRKI